ncbi:MAG: tetratricopeptide repeat protein [Planctomycetota bacterium]|jgi:tetratricopeptide (TPR) repeat protein
MFCSKIGSDCPHPVGTDEKLIFVMMPFDGFTNVYDAIVQAVEGTDGKQYNLERADTRFTNLSIWCDRICKNIRRAKYLIVDTTGRNPNVFYELGFSHAMQNTKAIIITQNVQDAPFDIADINHVEYSKDNLPDLRTKIKAAITDLDSTEPDESYANKTADEVVIDLKAQLRTEEQRSADFKNQLVETEKREKQLKEHIREIEDTKTDPGEEAKKRIIAFERDIAELRAKVKLTEEDKQDTIKQLNKTIEEKEQKLTALERQLETFKASKDEKPLADSLLDDSKRRSEAMKWLNRGNDEFANGKKEKAIGLFSKAIELDANYASAYYNRGVAYGHLQEYERAIQDFNKALELNPNRPAAYNNRGLAYVLQKEYERAINDYHKAVELDPKYIKGHQNISELKIIMGKYQEALGSAEEARTLAATILDKAEGMYLECIARKLLKMDTSEAEKAFGEAVRQDFTTAWSFDPIDTWVKEADIDDETKTFIAEKTELLKKHVR